MVANNEDDDDSQEEIINYKGQYRNLKRKLKFLIYVSVERLECQFLVFPPPSVLE